MYGENIPRKKIPSSVPDVTPDTEMAKLNTEPSFSTTNTSSRQITPIVTTIVLMTLLAVRSLKLKWGFTKSS